MAAFLIVEGNNNYNSIYVDSRASERSISSDIWQLPDVFFQKYRTCLGLFVTGLRLVRTRQRRVVDTVCVSDEFEHDNNVKK